MHVCTCVHTHTHHCFCPQSTYTPLHQEGFPEGTPGRARAAPLHPVVLALILLTDFSWPACLENSVLHECRNLVFSGIGSTEQGAWCWVCLLDWTRLDGMSRGCLFGVCLPPHPLALMSYLSLRTHFMPSCHSWPILGPSSPVTLPLAFLPLWCYRTYWNIWLFSEENEGSVFNKVHLEES